MGLLLFIQSLQIRNDFYTHSEVVEFELFTNVPTSMLIFRFSFVSLLLLWSGLWTKLIMFNFSREILHKTDQNQGDNQQGVLVSVVVAVEEEDEDDKHKNMINDSQQTANIYHRQYRTRVNRFTYIYNTYLRRGRAVLLFLLLLWWWWWLLGGGGRGNCVWFGAVISIMCCSLFC